MYPCFIGPPAGLQSSTIRPVHIQSLDPCQTTIVKYTHIQSPLLLNKQHRMLLGGGRRWEEKANGIAGTAPLALRFASSFASLQLLPSLLLLCVLQSSENGDESWVQWFCGLKGHEHLCEVERSYIEDSFNLYGLRGTDAIPMAAR
jgi:hypothetical protein